MRDIICEATIFYGANARHPNTLRVLFRMKDPVNGHLLQIAAAQALQRYPYYAVRCVSDGREYLLEPHSEPLAVCNTPKPVALDAPLYKGSPLSIAYLPYTDRVRQKPFDTQATIYRGMLILAADHERLQASIKASTQLYKAIDQQPTVERKCQLVNQVVSRYHGGATFNVSYVGPARLAAMEPYVLETQLQNDSPDLTVEIMAAHGSFFLTIVQEWKEDLYFDAFCEELKAQGIEYQLLSRGVHQVPSITLP